MTHFWFVLLLWIGLSACAPVSIQTSPTALDVSGIGVQTGFFPHQSTFRHSKQLTVTYYENYKHVRFLSNGNAEEDNWYLVQRGTAVPSVPFGSKVVMVPLQRLAIGTWRYAGAIELLGLAPAIVAYGNYQNITVPSLLSRLKSGSLSRNFTPELVAGLNVDAILNYYSNNELNRERSTYTRLGVVSLPMAEHLEADPIARAEWIKVLGLLFNREADANRIFELIVERYAAMKALAANPASRPLVMVNNRIGSQWSVYGAENVAAQMIRDAGGEYLWKDVHDRLSITPVSLELAWDRSFDASIWLLGADFVGRRDMDSAIVKDRYTGKIPALLAGHAYACANLDEESRNPWWDWALVEPDSDLADHVHIIHPELLPHHRLRFYRKVLQP